MCYHVTTHFEHHDRCAPLLWLQLNFIRTRTRDPRLCIESGEFCRRTWWQKDSYTCHVLHMS